MNKKYYILPILLLLCGTMSIAKASDYEKLDVAQVLANLENPDPIVREEAVQKIQRFSAQLELSHYEANKYYDQVMEALKKRLTDKEKRVRYISAVTLKAHYMSSGQDMGTILSDTKALNILVTPVFIEAVKDKETDRPRVLEDIMHKLGSLEYQEGAEELKARKEEVITALKEHLEAKDKYVRYAAAIALGELDSSGTKDIVLPVFLEALADKDNKIARYYKNSIANVCGNMGPDAKEAVPGLIQAMKEADLRGWADDYIRALMEIGTPEAMEAAAGGWGALIMARILTYHPVSDFVIVFCFGWLFWKSVKLRKKGKKVFHWFLIIPVLVYILNGIMHMSAYVGSEIDILENRQIFIIFASISLIPWLLSWLFIWRSEKRKKQPVS